MNQIKFHVQFAATKTIKSEVSEVVWGLKRLTKSRDSRSKRTDYMTQQGKV